MTGILTYAQLLGETDSEKVFLAEIEPARRITAWQLSAGMVYTYAAQTDPAMVVSRVKEEKLFLTARNSVAEVEAAASSWFFDAAAEKLYVRTSDSADPEAHFMTVYFLEVFATHPRVFNNRFYQPKIAQIPEFRQSVSEKNPGNSIQANGRLVMLEDSSKPYFAHMLYRYNWLNKRVTVKLGGADKNYPYSEFKAVAKWLLQGNKYTDGSAEFDVADLKSLFKTRIGLAKYSLADYPNMDTALEGRSIQIALGQIKNGRAALIDSTAGAGGRWKLALHALDGIAAVYDDGAPVAFTPDLAHGEFVLNAAAQGRITADFTGVKSGGVWLKKGGELAQHLLLSALPLGADDVLAADFAALDAARAFTLGIYIDKPTRLDEALALIEKSTHSFFFTDRESGRIRVRAFAAPDPEDPGCMTLDDRNLFKFEAQTEIGLAHEISVSYGRDHSAGDDKFVSLASLDSVYMNDFEEIKTVETALVNKADAETLAGLLLPFHSQPRLVAQVETHIRPLDRNLHDNVRAFRGRPDLPDEDYTFRLTGLRERATRDKKRVSLSAARRFQPGAD